MEYGPRVEYNPSSQMYMIHRPATDERAEVHYYVSEVEVMKHVEASTGKWTQDDILESLFNERVDEFLRPIRRREAIEHSRSLP